MNIFVAKLNYRTSSEALENLFSQYGEVTSAKVIMDKDTGRSKGFAFVEMATEDAGIAAIAGLNETSFDGQTTVCKKQSQGLSLQEEITILDQEREDIKISCKKKLNLLRLPYTGEPFYFMQSSSRQSSPPAL
ncbi:MAG: hypothetical protein IPP49_04045 [Saprospiraceae bacterium]|nr:hypothetical protein [Saprospiraceae bacterium]